MPSRLPVPVAAPIAVLVVEDEQCIRDILVELFDTERTAVTAAATLDEALDALHARAFDLVVTDIRLGGKRDGGLQVMAAAGLLADDAPVIVLTAYPDDDNRFASERLGATHFLEKPVDLATIAALGAQHGVPTAMNPGATRPSAPGRRRRSSAATVEPPGDDALSAPAAPPAP
jgi:DNA-binding NtrC family response regulator